MNKKPSIAIIHYWLVTMRGGEKVLEALCQLYPDADIYTHIYNPTKISPLIKSHKIFTTAIASLPFAQKHYQKYLPLMPYALEQLDLSGYDLIISSESGPAKGIIADSRIPHICYCHTPMRYLWDHYHRYLKESGLLTRFVFSLTATRLRLWDLATANRVSHFVANSQFVAGRIKHIYRKEAEVIYPPVDLSEFQPAQKKGNYFLFLGQLVGYKRADLALEAFTQNGLPLIIIGEGKIKQKLPAHIKVIGRVNQQEKLKYLSEARALIFPGEEDFGIVPVESIASGTPVLAYSSGGALETVTDGVSGLFFKEQTVDSLNEAVNRFIEQEKTFNYPTMRKTLDKFDISVFKEQFGKLVQLHLYCC